MFQILTIRPIYKKAFRIKDYHSFFSTKTYVVGHYYVLLSTQTNVKIIGKKILTLFHSKYLLILTYDNYL